MDSAEIDEFLSSGYWEIDRGRTATLAACKEVLARLPSNLAGEIIHLNTINLIAPGAEWGLTRPVSFVGPVNPVELPPVPGFSNRRGSDARLHRTELSMIYLSPEFEGQAHEVIVAVIAHEVAHAVTRKMVGDECERLADEKTRAWGFGKELEALRTANPAHKW